MNVRPDFNLISRVSEMLKDMLGDDFDQETFLDTLDGETDAMDIVGRLIRDREERKAHQAASKALADEYSTRAKRMGDGVSAINAVLGEVLDAMGERKIAHPLGTVSRTKGRARVRIDDERAIPSQLTITTVKPDAAAIKKQLEAGERVPGASLETGPEGLTVRVK